MENVLELQELPAREREDFDGTHHYSSGSWQTCL